MKKREDAAVSSHERTCRNLGLDPQKVTPEELRRIIERADFFGKRPISGGDEPCST